MANVSLKSIPIPRDLVLRILREALITVANDGTDGQRDAALFDIHLAPLDQPQHPTPIGVACVCKTLRELTLGELFEDKLVRFQEAFKKGSPRPDQTEGCGLFNQYGLPQKKRGKSSQYAPNSAFGTLMKMARSPRTVNSSSTPDTAKTGRRRRLWTSTSFYSSRSTGAARDCTLSF